MKYEAQQDKTFLNHWRSEAIDSDGSCFVVVFSGPEAEKRARQFTDWQNSNTCKHVEWRGRDSMCEREVVCAHCGMVGEQSADGKSVYYPAT